MCVVCVCVCVCVCVLGGGGGGGGTVFSADDFQSKVMFRTYGGELKVMKFSAASDISHVREQT